jgi:hypothetical protein
MPFFGRRHPAPGPVTPPGLPGLAEQAAAQGWQPVTGRPFGPDVVDGIHDITRAMYGAGRLGANAGRPVGETTFSDAFRTRLDSRTVVVANANTFIDPALFQAGRFSPDVAVCAVELATMVPVTIVQPDRIEQISRWGAAELGNPAFDDRFRVNTGNPGFVRQILTPEVQQRISMRDDWVFWLGEHLFACVAKGKFRTTDEISSRVTEVLGIVSAIPATVMPSEVDLSADDLVSRISRIDGVDDAIAFLQGLTPDERDRLARSDTPLAAFADVRTPEEAMARFGSLPEAQRMQLLAMFARVGEAEGRG